MLLFYILYFYIYNQGLSTAYTLRKAGHSVVVLEKRDATSAVCFLYQEIPPLCLYTDFQTFSMGGVMYVSI